jgi:hypothetical protein
MLTLINHGWVSRLHFGFWLLIYGELMAWQNAANYTPLDWLALAIIYLALGTICLDFIERMQINTLRTLLLVGGLFGLARALTISVIRIDADHFAIDLIFLPLGVEALMFVLAFYSFQYFASGKTPSIYTFILSAVIGFAWGTWTRWSPDLESLNILAPDWDESLPYVIMALVLAGIIHLILHLDSESDWLLTPYEWAVAGGVLIVTAVLRGNAGHIDLIGFGIIGMLLVVITCMVFFTRQTRPTSLLKTFHTAQHPQVIQWLPVLIPFALCAWAAYNLSDGDKTPLQATALFRLLLIFGLAWLPLVSVTMGIQTLRQLLREGY